VKLHYFVAIFVLSYNVVCMYTRQVKWIVLITLFDIHCFSYMPTLI